MNDNKAIPLADQPVDSGSPRFKWRNTSGLHLRSPSRRRSPSARHPEKGFPVVLTADRSLMARYQLLLDGMFSASQTTRTPTLLMKKLLAPPVLSNGLRARQAPLGLRRIEAALLVGGWNPEEVAVVAPESLGPAIGPETRIIGISSGDPLGIGMNSTTMAGLVGGQIVTSRWFQQLVSQLKGLRSRAPEAQVVMGGPGAWQLVQNSGARRALGIDHVVTGYCEDNVAHLFCQIADSQGLPPVLVGKGAAARALPALRDATVMGAVEVSRGCGLGCRFCTIARVPMMHLPIETILADVQTNVAAGVTNVSLITEDIFRYGCDDGGAQPARLLELLREIRGIPGLRLIQSDHANLASVAQFSDAELEDAQRLFVGENGRHEYVWLNLGLESAAGELLAAAGGRSKMRPYRPEQWGEVCLEQIRRLTRAGFLPMVSLILGLPGETPGAVEKTAQWVRQLKREPVMIFPLFFAPVDGESRAFAVGDMSTAHWQLFQECYRLNFKWLPRLYWDNQSGAGVKLWRRLLLEMLGRMQVLWWKGIFAWRSGRLY